MKHRTEIWKIAVAIVLLAAFVTAIVLEFTPAGQQAADTCIFGAP
ncbi:hypothetical protein [Chitinophaga agri]|nr:hypothetical protein [Chitinophaga agri]